MMLYRALVFTFGLVVFFVIGCGTVIHYSGQDSMNRLWEEYRERNITDNTEVFIEYKQQKKEQRYQYVTVVAEDKDDTKRLLLGLVNISSFLTTRMIMPPYTDNMFATPTYILEDYASKLPLGKD